MIIQQARASPHWHELYNCIRWDEDRKDLDNFYKWAFYFAEKLFSPNITLNEVMDIINMYEGTHIEGLERVFKKKQNRLENLLLIYKAVLDDKILDKLLMKPDSCLMIVCLQFYWSLNYLKFENFFLHKDSLLEKWIIQNDKPLHLDKWYYLINKKCISMSSDIAKQLCKAPDIDIHFINRIRHLIWFKEYTNLVKMYQNQSTNKKRKIPLEKDIYVLDYSVTGYKILRTKDGHTRLLAKVHIPKNAIIVRTSDNLRCSEYTILWIKDQFGVNYSLGFSPILDYEYEKDKFHTSFNMNRNPKEKCVRGLHFFDNVDQALKSSY